MSPELDQVDPVPLDDASEHMNTREGIGTLRGHHDVHKVPAGPLDE